MKIEITSLELLCRAHAMDHLVINTTLPAAGFPFEGTESLVMFVAKGTGEEYCKKNFPGVPLKIVKAHGGL